MTTKTSTYSDFLGSQNSSLRPQSKAIESYDKNEDAVQPEARSKAGHCWTMMGPTKDIVGQAAILYNSFNRRAKLNLTDLLFSRKAMLSAVTGLSAVRAVCRLSPLFCTETYF